MSFIKLTENSKIALQKFLNEGGHPSDSTYLRISINGTSCSGPRFSLYFDENYNAEHDELIDDAGLKIVTNKLNLEHLSGYTIDYQKKDDVAGFVFGNPLKNLGCSSTQGCCGGGSCETSEKAPS